jgi:hypothetical protein
MDFTIIDEVRAATVRATRQRDTVRLAPDALRTALGWELKPQGLCKDDQCIPVGRRAELVTDDGVELTALAALLGRPLAIDADAGAACLGVAAADRAARLQSLAAPDFTLPDLTGKLHALSDYRGKKILLVAYASW